MTWRSATLVVWAALGLLTVVLVALALTGKGGVLARPFASLRAHLDRHRVARVAAVIGWVWLGWHAFAR